MMRTLAKNSTGKENILIRPTLGWASLNLRDLWVYRELVYFLTWRDLKVRYKQTLLGVAWAIIQPVFTMVVFTFIFGQIAHLDSEGLPYPIFAYTALLPWGLFSKALSDSGRSVVANSQMITKIYFPRLVIPISSVISGVVDFLIGFLVLLGLMVYFHIAPTSAIWTLPFFLLLALVTAVGVGLWLSALNVMYRDIGYILPFMVEAWKYLSPVAYSANEISGKWKLVYALNPMAGVIQGFRWALLGTKWDPAGTGMVAISTAIAILILISGLFFFRRMERNFADLV